MSKFIYSLLRDNNDCVENGSEEETCAKSSSNEKMAPSLKIFSSFHFSEAVPLKPGSKHHKTESQIVHCGHGVRPAINTLSLVNKLTVS